MRLRCLFGWHHWLLVDAITAASHTVKVKQCLFCGAQTATWGGARIDVTQARRLIAMERLRRSAMGESDG